MDTGTDPEPARDPDDLGRFFVTRANAGDLDGLVALYKPATLPGRLDGRQISGANVRLFAAFFVV